MISEEDFPEEYFKAKYIHIATNFPKIQNSFIDLIRKKSNAIISIDTHEAYMETDSEYIKKVFDKVDIAFIDKEFTNLLDCNAPIKIIKMGKSGCKYIDSTEEFIVNANETNVVDKTGAGDVVTGVFLAMMSKTNDKKKSLEEAVKMATESIKKYGVDELCNLKNNKKIIKEVMKMRDEEKSFSKTSINWFPGHMAKTRREISEKLNLIDIVYEVLDARMPISSKIVDIDDLIKDKPKILVVTKYDLCDTKETDKILEVYKKQGYNVLPIDLMNGNCNELINKTKDIMKKINEERIAKGMKERSARVLIIGVPNVGKSTLINRLVGRKSAGVGNTPGFTKNLSWIRINKDIELLDSPGILWPKIEDQEKAHVLASLSSIKEEILNTDQVACFILKKLYELYPEKLYERYGISELDEDYIEAYELIGKKRGALSKGGIVDYEKVSNIIIKDLKSNYFGKITFDRI